MHHCECASGAAGGCSRSTTGPGNSTTSSGNQTSRNSNPSTRPDIDPRFPPPFPVWEDPQGRRFPGGDPEGRVGGGPLFFRHHATEVQAPVKVPHAPIWPIELQTVKNDHFILLKPLGSPCRVPKSFFSFMFIGFHLSWWCTKFRWSSSKLEVIVIHGCPSKCTLKIAGFI